MQACVVPRSIVYSDVSSDRGQAMTVPPSRPAGFTPRAGLVLDCPICGDASLSLGNGHYTCVGIPAHSFLGGWCDDCQQISTRYDGNLNCGCSAVHREDSAG